ncbi:MAG: VWA domain-containing protein [Alphaproteobacteria bacterium]|nr:VWA domain-containing protein [Alphaproteobacteria bacterium]MBV9542216.1 VWA domain-containing protein [Alphaproteobacteria bacterium]MBV9904540.1 VWA domain-containing protein [Alphaproteobacteria bacterium]
MFFQFFDELRAAKIPVTLKEYLALMDALDKDVIDMKIEDFYFLSRTALVKDERNLDKFDRVFGHVFKGLEGLDPSLIAQIPEEWLKALTERFLTDEEKKALEKAGGWDKLMEKLKQQMEEQKKRHEKGGKAIGTGGTSPYGNGGYNPEGVRIGQDKSRHGKAIKVWDKREYKNLDDSVELGTRNIKVALRRLRKWARQGAETELDMPGTIKDTANKGYLDLKLVPERHNTVKVLLFFDIGGSMDAHIKLCEELFSAAKTEFKHMDFYYFHNCLYESVWKDNRRRHNEKIDTWDVLNKYPRDYKIIFVGDATMSPYEVTYPGGSVEHWNEEPGAVWIDRVTNMFEHVAWLNPVAEKHWEYTPSIGLFQQLTNNRMFPLTLGGLDNAMKELNR